MNAPAKIEEQVSLRALARQALKDAGGKTKLAIDALTAQLMNDKRLMREVVAEAVVIASDDLVQHSMRATREAVVVSAAKARNGVAALANGIKFSILDFPLAGGVKLRDATPAEVTEQIDRYEAIGRDVTHKARWLRLVVQGVPRDRRIGDVISDERAQELWNEASK